MTRTPEERQAQRAAIDTQVRNMERQIAEVLERLATVKAEMAVIA